MNTNTDQEAEALARKIHEKHRLAIGGVSFPFDRLPSLSRQGWLETAKLFLEEQAPVTKALIEEVHSERALRLEWEKQANKHEDASKHYKHCAEGWEKKAKDLAEKLVAAEQDLGEWRKVAEEREAELAKVKHDLHHTRLYGEAKAFEVAKLKGEANAKPEGIEGTLIQAGTLTDGAEVFSGIVLSVPWEALRDAKRMPFYCKVKVIEIPTEPQTLPSPLPGKGE